MGLNWGSRPAEVAAAFPEGCAELKGGVTILTGPTAGIGIATARAIAALGGRLVLGARSQTKAEVLIADIRAAAPGAGPLSFIELDLSSLASVEAFTASYVTMSAAGGWPPLRCIVCNAGVFNFSGAFRQTADGFEETFGVNHLAYFYLIALLLPQLRAAAPARVVVVSSGSHFGCAPPRHRRILHYNSTRIQYCTATKRVGDLTPHTRARLMPHAYTCVEDETAVQSFAVPATIQYNTNTILLHCYESAWATSHPTRVHNPGRIRRNASRTRTWSEASQFRQTRSERASGFALVRARTARPSWRVVVYRHVFFISSVVVV